MMSFAVVVVVKATLVCGVALLFSRLCRRTRASIRHVVLALAFAALVVIPGAGSAVPGLAVTVPAAITSSVERTQAIVSVSQVEESGTAPIARIATAERSVTATQVAMIIWLTGVALFMTPVVAGFWQVRRLRERALPWTEGQELVQTLASALGLRRRIDAVIHDAVPGPMTYGIQRPCIIVPASARHWEEATLTRALRHEIEHVARWDFLTNCAARAVCAVYWFHPWVWAAWRRLRLDAELACDDAVVQEDDAREYAALLVAMAQGDAAGTRPLLAMAGRDDLAVRVAALLDHQQTRGRVGRRWAAGLTVAGTIGIAGVASITVARAMPQSQATGAGQSTTFADASIKRLPPSQLRRFDGRITATGLTVHNLLAMAFAVREVVNAPLWVRMDRFDIVANAPNDVTQTGESKNLQALLVERFKLVAHRETRDFPVYALVLARPDRSLGPQLTSSQVDCSRRDAIRARALGGLAPAADAGAPPNCSTSSSDGRIAGSGVTMEEFAENLPTHLRFYGTQLLDASMARGVRLFDRPLLDRTGLTGRFDFRLEWEQDRGGSVAGGLEANAPRFLAALQQQLGLTIESQTAPAPVLVIDQIEPPTEN